MSENTPEVGIPEVEYARNRAENGRCFCGWLVCISLVVYLVTQNNLAFILAILAVVPIGLAVLVDSLPDGRLRTVLHLIAFLLPVSVVVGQIAIACATMGV